MEWKCRVVILVFYHRIADPLEVLLHDYEVDEIAESRNCNARHWQSMGAQRHLGNDEALVFALVVQAVNYW